MGRQWQVRRDGSGGQRRRDQPVGLDSIPGCRALSHALAQTGPKAGRLDPGCCPPRLERLRGARTIEQRRYDGAGPPRRQAHAHHPDPWRQIRAVLRRGHGRPGLASLRQEEISLEIAIALPQLAIGWDVFC